MPQVSGLFLDLDGVLWPDSGAGAILDPKNLATGIENLRVLSRQFGTPKIFIISNQTFAARGQIDYDFFESYVNKCLDFFVNQNLLTDYRICYHHPNAINSKLKQTCSCRKPSPKMILDLINKYKIKTPSALFVGDRISDIVAAQLAGIKRNYLLNNSKMLNFNEYKIALPQSIYFSVINNFDDINEDFK